MAHSRWRAKSERLSLRVLTATCDWLWGNIEKQANKKNESKATGLPNNPLGTHGDVHREMYIERGTQNNSESLLVTEEVP